MPKLQREVPPSSDLITPIIPIFLKPSSIPTDINPRLRGRESYNREKSLGGRYHFATDFDDTSHNLRCQADGNDQWRTMYRKSRREDRRLGERGAIEPELREAENRAKEEPPLASVLAPPLWRNGTYPSHASSCSLRRQNIHNSLAVELQSLKLTLSAISHPPARACLSTQLFYSFFKTLKGKTVIVELKNNVCIEGTLEAVDQYLNLRLSSIRITEESKYPHMVCITSFISFLSDTL